MTHQRIRAFARRLLAVAVLLLVSTEWADADIYSTFDGDSYDNEWSHSILEGWPKGFAFSFIGEQTYALNSIELEMAVSLVSGVNKLEVSIMTADTGGKPGTVLKSFSFDNRLNSDSAILKGTPVSVVSGSMLEPDRSYWLVASAPTGTWVKWYLSLPPVSGQMATSFGDSWEVYNGETVSAFRIRESTLVPIPGAVLLGAIGLGYSGWRLRRRAA